MSDLTLILLAAGSGTRFDKPLKKQWMYVDREPLWLNVVRRFEAMKLFGQIIISGHPADIEYMRRFVPHLLTPGGTTRQASLVRALRDVTSSHVLVNDVARACIQRDVCVQLINQAERADCIVPALPLQDTIYYEGKPADRTKAMRIQTPQLSRTALLRKALEQGIEYTDESSAVHALGGKIVFVEGDERMHKLTTAWDLEKLPCLQPPDLTLILTGNGYDVHAFEPGKPMVLGGIRIDAPMGFKAHSDGDVAIHALIDALLGAAAMGDIGELFPDTDEAYRNIDSTRLLEQVVGRIRGVGLEIVNADVTIAAQTPRLKPYKEAMRQRLAQLLGILPGRCNVKATTTEKLGFVGRKEGVAVTATATLKPFNWMDA